MKRSVRPQVGLILSLLLFWLQACGTEILPENPQVTSKKPQTEAPAQQTSPTATTTPTNDEDDSEPPVVDTTTVFQITGTVRFDRPRITTNGLDFDNLLTVPVTGASLRVFRKTNTSIALATTRTSYDGTFALQVTGASSWTLLLCAQSPGPEIRIEDPQDGDALHCVSKNFVTPWVNAPATDPTKVITDLHLPTGWGGSSYTGTRFAAPFAILTTLQKVAFRMQSVDPALQMPALKVNWTANGTDGSYYDGEELYILGNAGVDTDEFDDAVIIHEWGHFFEDKLSRADSLGGGHGFGDVLEPTVAFSEGFGNALAGIIQEPFHYYVDTSGISYDTGILIDLEADEEAGSQTGWFSEATVERVLFDLFDANSDGTDTLEAGLPAMYDVLTGPQVDTPGFTTIFSFVHGLYSLYPALETDVDTYLGSHGIDPVQNALGSSESNLPDFNLGGWDYGPAGTGSFVLPVYHLPVVDGSAIPITFAAENHYAFDNKLVAVRYLHFLGDGNELAVRVSDSWANNRSLGLEIYDRGTLLDWDGFGLAKDEPSVSVQSAAGKTYSVRVYNLVQNVSEFAVEVNVETIP